MTTFATHIRAGKPWPAATDGALAAAKKLHERGCMVVPAPYRHKNPARGALDLRLTASDLPQYFSDNEPMNVGVVMGDRSSGLVDVNINDPTARIIARQALGWDTLTFGHTSSPASHYLLYTQGLTTVTYKDPSTSETIVEIRANEPRGKKPNHTVFPPSTHEQSGERISFDDGTKEPLPVPSGEVMRAVARLAAATILRKAWAWERVQDFAVVGALVRAGWSDERINGLLALVTGKPAAPLLDNARGRAGRGEPIAGWSAVEDSLGKATVKDIVRWLDARPRAGKADFEGRAVAELIDNAPVPNLRMPDGYSLNATDTLVLGDDDEDGNPGEAISIMRAPLLITGKMRSSSGDNEKLHLSWQDHSGWQSIAIARTDIMDATRIVKCAGSLPVASDNARNVVKYMRLFDAANSQHLPTATFTSQLGWQGARGFLVGLTRVCDDGEHSADIDNLTPSDWPTDAYAFHGASDGDRRIANGYRTCGTLDGWRDLIIGTVLRYPAVAAGFFAALVPPLMEPLCIPNFVIDYACTTSLGKTTAMRAAASIWGCPDERSQEGSVIHPWNATRVMIERLCTLSNGLPVFLDDSKTTRNPKDMETTVYDLTQGQTRGRGDPLGIRQISSFHTVMLSTGENPLTSFSQAGGTRTRVLTISEPPFGEATSETLADVTRINREAKIHYGHAGRAWIRTVLSRRGDWPDWAARYLAGCARWSTRITPGAGARLVEYLAAVDLAADLAGQALCLPPDCHAPALGVLMNCAETQSATAAPETRALDCAWHWAVAHQQEFWGRHRTVGKDEDPVQPSTGWAGIWPTEDWEAIHWIPERLKAILEDGGFDADSVLGAWRRKRVIRADKSAYTTRLPRVFRQFCGGAAIRVVSLFRSAIPDAANEEEK